MGSRRLTSRLRSLGSCTPPPASSSLRAAIHPRRRLCRFCALAIPLGIPACAGPPASPRPPREARGSLAGLEGGPSSATTLVTVGRPRSPGETPSDFPPKMLSMPQLSRRKLNPSIEAVVALAPVPPSLRPFGRGHLSFSMGSGVGMTDSSKSRSLESHSIRHPWPFLESHREPIIRL